MSKSISVISAIESNKLSSDTPYLCLLDIEIVDRDTGLTVATKHLVRNPEPITFRGNVYEQSMFDISLNQKAGSSAEVNLSVVDYTQVLQALMEAHAGGIGSKITFYVVNAADLTADPDALEYFEIVGASSANYTQSFTLGAENNLMQTFPRRRQVKDFCQWRYKSDQCKYTAAMTAGVDKPSCDLSLQGPNGCGVHNNTINFGAYPGLNSNGFRYA